MLDVAVAFVIFNRPEPTRVSFARIRDAQPAQLFLVSDGPRADRPGEAEKVQQVREIAEQIDWPSRVSKIYSEVNLGCGRRISSAITQAFEQVDRLIVLEDDCVPDPTFFDYCSALLERYEHDERIMSVGGNNFQQRVSRTDASYYFSKYSHCWGWATWRRAWRKFDLSISAWPAFRDSGGLAACCQNRSEIEYWTRIMNRCHAQGCDSWAYPWLLACWMNHGLSTVPDMNLVSNHGFGDDATHTHRTDDKTSELQTEPMHQIKHPEIICRNHFADSFTDQQLFSGPEKGQTFKRWRRKLGFTRSAA